MHYSIWLFAAVLLTDASEADSDVEWHSTGDYQSRLADRVLDGSESAHSVFTDDDSSCLVSFLQTSIMRKPAEAQHPEPTITSACVPIPLRTSTLAYITFFIMFVVAILTFAASAPVHSSAHMPAELATNSSACPKLAALDGFRVYVCTLVIINHMGSKLGSVGNFVVSIGGSTAMSYFMILSGFIRVITAKRQNSDNGVGPRFRHNIARLIARFAPAYYLALAVCMIQEKEQINIMAPIEALFLQGCLTERLRDCFGLHGDQVFEISWFVADIFLLVAFSPVFDKMLQCVSNGVTQALLSVTLVSLPIFTGGINNPWFVGYRAFEFVGGMILAQMVKQLPDWALRWTGWRHLFDCTFILIQFKMFVLQNGQGFIPISSLQGFIPISSLRLLILIQVVEGWLWCMMIVCNYCETMGGGSHGVFSSILGWRPYASLAAYSFGAYIYQGVVRRIWEGLFPVWSQSCLFNSLMIPLVWVFAVGSEKYMEGPIRRHVEARMKGVPTSKV
jgi:hypothetical protein